MKDLPLRNIFLPATLVGASIFSALAFTLPVVINQFSQKGFPEGSELVQRSQMTLSSVHKEIVITYIGTAIVVSASAGLGAAELLRKRSEKRPKAPDLKSVLAEFVDNHAQRGTAEMDVELSSLFSELPIAAPASPWPTSETLSERETPHSPEQTYVFPEEMPEAPWESPPFQTAIAPPSVEAVEPEADSMVVIFPAQYQRCRVRVPGLSEQRYAIEFDHQFYSLLSAGVSKEQALATVKQLAQEQRAAILTQMNHGFVVWVIEPTAELVSVA